MSNVSVSNVSFEEQLSILREEPEKGMENVRKFHSELLSLLELKAEEAERGIPNSPDVPVEIAFSDRKGFRKLRNEDPAVKLIALSLGRRVQKEDIYLKNYNYNSPYIERIIDKTKDYLYRGGNRIESVENGGGKFNYPKNIVNHSKGSISLKVIPSGYLDDLDNVPRILFPLLEDLMAFDNHEESDKAVKMIINHEMTHAYIYNKQPKGLQNLYNLDEGAAQAVSNILYPDRETQVMFYRNSESYDRASLQVMKKLFLLYSQRFDGKGEKIYQVRRRAVKVIRKKMINSYIPDILRRGNTSSKLNLVEAVLGEENKRLEKTYDIIRKLELVEEESFHALVLLNILPEDAMEEQFDRINFRLFEALNEDINELFPEEVSINLNPDSETGDFQEINLKAIFKEGIRELDSILRNDEESLRSYLADEERKIIESARNDLEEALEIYSEEQKVENMYRKEFDEKYDAESQKIADWVKERVSDPQYTDPVRLAKNIDLNLERMVEDYIKIIDTGLEYNSQLIDCLSSVYDEEKETAAVLRKYSERKQYGNLAEMIEQIETVYSMLQESQERLANSKEKLEKVRVELDSME